MLYLPGLAFISATTSPMVFAGNAGFAISATGIEAISPIAVLSDTRCSLLPDVPTAKESGLPGFVSVLHYGLLAPAGTPRPIVDKLNAELRKLVMSDEVKQRIHSEGGDPLISTPDEYAADIDQEEAKWSALIRKLNLKVE